MSDDKVVHVAHEFIPKLLRRKVEAALANRDAFVLEKKKQMIPYLLANRNAAIAYRALPWYKKSFFSSDWDGEIMSVEEAARVPFDNYDTMKAAMSFWRFGSGRSHPYDPIVYGPHHDALDAIMDEIRTGSKWVKHIRALHNNLKRTPTRRVSVSEDVLSSITYWAAQGNHPSV